VLVRVEVVLPKWGMTMQEGTIASWAVSPGSVVHEGDALAIVETEKVETELPSPASGRIVEIVVAAGDTVEVGTVVAWLETD
jgi:pyruvate/2-oxoglutarate dehydrogenase complex dihydrolipoamide acyltransferase (E2) component